VGIAAADLDADGRQDLVTADNGSSQVSVILRNGTGGYQPAAPYAVGVGPTAIALANFEGDAKPDIAVTTFGTESLKLLVTAAAARSRRSRTTRSATRRRRSRRSTPTRTGSSTSRFPAAARTPWWCS
jgi:hypothetical protein